MKTSVREDGDNTDPLLKVIKPLVKTLRNQNRFDPKHAIRFLVDNLDEDKRIELLAPMMFNECDTPATGVSEVPSSDGMNKQLTQRQSASGTSPTKPPNYSEPDEIIILDSSSASDNADNMNESGLPLPSSEGVSEQPHIKNEDIVEDDYGDDYVTDDDNDEVQDAIPADKAPEHEVFNVTSLPRCPNCGCFDHHRRNSKNYQKCPLLLVDGELSILYSEKHPGKLLKKHVCEWFHDSWKKVTQEKWGLFDSKAIPYSQKKFNKNLMDLTCEEYKVVIFNVLAKLYGRWPSENTDQ